MPPLLFDNATSHEILSLLAYHPRDFDAGVLSISTDRDRVVDFHRPPACGTLGDLDALPIELLNAVLQCSDLRTVSTLRLLNQHARVVVDASVPYKHILLHVPRVLAALERTGIASHFLVDEVFNALSTPACRICGGFGTFLWIPECIRCCFRCLREAPELMPNGRTRCEGCLRPHQEWTCRSPHHGHLVGHVHPFQNPAPTKTASSQSREGPASCDRCSWRGEGAREIYQIWYISS